MHVPTLDPDAVVWHRPAAVDGEQRPLLVLLHGFGGHERDFDPFVQQLPEGYAIASVRAPLVHNRGWAWFPRNFRSLPGITPSQLADQAADALLGWLRTQQHPAVDLLGFSQGGSVAVHAMRRDPRAVRAVVTLAGFLAPGRQLGDAELRVAPHPVFSGSGGRDDVIGSADTERLEAWLSRHSILETRRYADLDHWMSARQFDEVAAFLRTTSEGASS